MLLTRPQRSAIIENGRVSTPTANGTTPLIEPSFVSVSCHCTFKIGNKALSAWRDM
jgi:hypothetical protein